MAHGATESESVRIVWDAGVHLEGTILWFDPSKVRQFAAITHAAIPIRERQKRLLWGDRTARLVGAHAKRRIPGLVTPFGRSFSMGNLDLQLFPSGYMTGAAQIQVTVDDHRVIYSGPISMQRNPTAEAIELRSCDTLVLDARLGNPRHRLPPRKEALAQLRQWIDDYLARNLTPVVLVDSPGPVQDVIKHMADWDVPIRVHRSIYAWNKAYRSAGVDLPACKQFRGHPARGEVLLWPAHLRRSPAIRNLRRARFAALSGAAADKGAARRLRAGVVFGYSAVADYDELLAYTEKAQAGRILTIGTYADDFAAALSERGANAAPLLTSPQLDLL